MQNRLIGIPENVQNILGRRDRSTNVSYMKLTQKAFHLLLHCWLTQKTGVHHPVTNMLKIIISLNFDKQFFLNFRSKAD